MDFAVLDAHFRRNVNTNFLHFGEIWEDKEDQEEQDTKSVAQRHVLMKWGCICKPWNEPFNFSLGSAEVCLAEGKTD